MTEHNSVWRSCQNKSGCLKGGWWPAGRGKFGPVTCYLCNSAAALGGHNQGSVPSLLSCCAEQLLAKPEEQQETQQTLPQNSGTYQMKSGKQTINCSDSISPELKHLRIEGGKINHFLWLPYGRGYVEIFKSEGTGLRNQADYMKLESTSTYFRKCSFLRGNSWMNPQINSLESRLSFSDKKYHIQYWIW